MLAAHISINKSLVFELMQRHGVFESRSEGSLSEKSKERINKNFKYAFGWPWQRFGRKRVIAPADLEARIVSWSRQLYTQHRIRQYNFVFFGDETSAFLDGGPHGMTLASVGSESMKISQTNEGEAVTVFLAGIVNVQCRSSHIATNFSLIGKVLR